MNQIPNIEETHNTREVEEWEREFRRLCAEDAEYQLRDRGVQAKIIAFIAHQLQKARQDWLQEEILSNKQYADISPFDHAEVVRVEALQTIIDRYQAELDQDNK